MERVVFLFFCSVTKVTIKIKFSQKLRREIMGIKEKKHIEVEASISVAMKVHTHTFLSIDSNISLRKFLNRNSD